MSFPWLQTTPTRKGGERRAQVELAELANRAGLLYRLGFTEAAATARLVARIAWEYDGPTHAHGTRAHHRPEALTDTAIAKLVAETYARRPG